jgi:hypothetical protein
MFCLQLQLTPFWFSNKFMIFFACSLCNHKKMSVPYVVAASHARQSFDVQAVADIAPVIATKVQEVYLVDLERALEQEEVASYNNNVSILLKLNFISLFFATTIFFIIIDSMAASEYKDDNTQTFVALDILFMCLISFSLMFLYEIKQSNNDVVIRWFRILFLASFIFYSCSLTKVPKNEFSGYFTWHIWYSVISSLLIFIIFLFRIELR